MSETAELQDRIKALEQELDKLRDRLAVIEARSWRGAYTRFVERPARVPEPFEERSPWVPEQFTYVDDSGTSCPPYSTSWPPDSTSPGPALLHWQPTPVL